MAELIDGVLMPSDTALETAREHIQAAVDAMTEDGLELPDAVGHVLWSATAEMALVTGSGVAAQVMRYFADEILADAGNGIKPAENGHEIAM